MQRIDGRLICSASDLNDFSECRRLSGLSREVAFGTRTRPDGGDETRALIAQKGEAHEAAYFERLKLTYGEGVVAFNGRARNTFADLRAAEAGTIAAMRAGAQLIYQATLFDGQFLGRADFLRRVPVPSMLGHWSYEVIDVKLALSTKPYFLIQLCNYSEHLQRIQGVMPEHGHVVLGTGEERAYRIDEYFAYYRRLKGSFLEFCEREPELPYPHECKHCETCLWQPTCEARRDADDHLSLVAFMRSDQVKKIESAGISTISQLAQAVSPPPKLAEKTFSNLRAQAQQQHLQREAMRNDTHPRYFREFRPFNPQTGFARLPEPNEGDVFFDIEGDPLYRSDRGLEYLWGYCDQRAYHAIWALEANAERRAFEQFVDTIMERLNHHPGLHVYHYGSYEPARMKRLMGIYGTRENEVNALLRGAVFCDLYDVVRQGLWISQPSYSIKKLEAFYGFRRTATTKRGDDSILMFESWLATRDHGILEDIRQYNEEDCRSTSALREWLLRERQTLVARRGEDIPWFSSSCAEEKIDEDEVSETERRLLTGIAAPASVDDLRAWSEERRARWLLGNLQRYHRREQRPEWWKYFERIANVEALQDDTEAIGGLRWRSDVEPAQNGRSNPVYTFEFPPQEHNVGNSPVCPDTQKSAGTIVELLHSEHLLRLKLNSKLTPQALRALIPGKPVPDQKKRKALEEIGDLYLQGELQNRYPALMDMLLARPPRVRDGSQVQPDEVTTASVSAVVQRLERSYLFIQGPPGSGKSTIAASCIVDLLQQGLRVGIAANSHKAVHNVLRRVEQTAYTRGLRFRACHKESAQTEGSAYDALPEWPMVESVEDVRELVSAGCQLASGTTFAWADSALAGAFDYLFVDEAGQVCLADAVLAARAARNIVLLGDPMQLPHVAKGSHPDGISLSVLDHVRDGARTVRRDYGIFLDRSYRMQPDICRFISEAVYEGRLHATQAAASNRVESPGIGGAGLRYIPMRHEGNRNRSDEEAQRIVDEIELLLRGSVTVNDGPARPITTRDILVVAPYNVQRARITALLGEAGHGGVRVGTVDKFQGQEAPVVFYSVAASSAQDVPRGMEFLFDTNRFNVAISRAQCMSVLVCNPELFETRCASPEHMALVNVFCRFRENAETLPV